MYEFTWKDCLWQAEYGYLTNVCKSVMDIFFELSVPRCRLLYLTLLYAIDIKYNRRRNIPSGRIRPRRLCSQRSNGSSTSAVGDTAASERWRYAIFGKLSARPPFEWRLIGKGCTKPFTS